MTEVTEHAHTLDKIRGPILPWQIVKEGKNEAEGSENWEADCGLSSFLIQPFMWVPLLRGSASRGSRDSCGSQTLARAGRRKLREGEVCFLGPLSPGLAGVWTSSLYKASVSQGGSGGGETYGPTGSLQAP